MADLANAAPGGAAPAGCVAVLRRAGNGGHAARQCVHGGAAEEIDGRLLYIRDYSASGHYQIVWEGVSAEAAEAYLTALLDKGFTRLMGTAEDIASGVLLARGDLTLSISLSGGTLNMLMTRAEEPTPTPLPEWLADW